MRGALSKPERRLTGSGHTTQGRPHVLGCNGHYWLMETSSEALRLHEAMRRREGVAIWALLS